MHPGDEGREVPARRRRRTPQIAEGEIIAAAEAFLRERPFREMTVDEVMRRTDLSRPSFYVYFTDRHQVRMRLDVHGDTRVRDYQIFMHLSGYYPEPSLQLTSQPALTM